MAHSFAWRHLYVEAGKLAQADRRKYVGDPHFVRAPVAALADRGMVDGFVLNHAMTNFSAAPKPGEIIANQMAPGKRPVTSMAPTIVFDPEGVPIVVGGSAGGGPIVDYIASSLGFLKRTSPGWIGAADPRRDGAAMGR